MIYQNIKKGIFLERPNRFIAICSVNGKEETVHVKNTGRCKELLTKGAEVFLQEFDTDTRKTKFDLISVYKGNRLINMDSQAPNKVFGEWAEKGNFTDKVSLIKPEYKFGNSRFDFYLESNGKKILVEVKGVTLENDGVVMFPDAPTQRGVKHIYELIEAKKQGYETYVFFVVQMEGVKYFQPNYATHGEFGKALKTAQENGVKICARDCIVTPDSLEINKEVEIKLL